MQESEERLRLAADAAGFGTYTYDFVSGVSHWSPELKTLLGVPPEKSMPLDADLLPAALHPDDRAGFLAAMTTANDPRGNGLFRHEYRVVHPDGTIRWMQVRGRTSFAGDGPVRHPAGAAGVVLDITERKHAEVALRDSERFAHATIDALAAHICVLDERGIIIAVNRAWRNFAAANQLVARNAGEGVNYLAICDAATGADADVAAAFASGIRAVLRGERAGFSLEYPCHSPAEQRWFTGRVTRFPGKDSIRVVVAHENITERKKAEEALRESEVKYRTLVEKANEAIAIAQDGVYVFANRRLYELLGVPVGTLEGRRFIDFVRPEDREQVMARYQKRIAGETTTDAYDFRIIGAGGRTSWVFLSAAAIQWNGRPATLNLITDITERKRAAETLQESEDRFRTMVEAASEGVWTVDDGYRTTFVNRRLAEMLGYTAEEILGQLPERFMFPEDEADHRQRMEARRRGQSGQYERRYRRKDGSTLWALISVAPRSGGAQTEPFRGAIAMLMDITERKRAEEALRESEERFRAVYEKAAIGIVLADVRGRILQANASFQRMLGRASEDLVGRTTEEFTHPEEVAFERTSFRQAMEEGRSDVQIQKRYVRKDGQIIWGNLTVSICRDAAGQPQFVIGLVEDITERKRAEEARETSEKRFRDISEHAQEWIWEVSVEGRYSYTSQVVEEILGYTPEEILQRHFYDLFLPEDREALKAVAFAAFAAKQPFRDFVNRNVHKNGQTVWLSTSGLPILDEQGNLLGYRGVDTDITKRKRAEEDLRELSGRLLRLEDEERRRLARELHDTTAQELAAISMNLAVLKARAPELTAGAQEILAETAALTDRCAREIRTMSYLLHPPAIEALGLAGAGRDYADGFARRSGIRVDLQISGDLGRLPAATELALFRVLQESLANIHRHSGSRTASIRLERTTGRVRLEVRDKGRGMNWVEGISAEGSPASGLGVGILGMRERMRHLGGQLQIESDAQGTCVVAIAPLETQTNQP